ncbi:CueP family metal-binding protein [Isoptericola cucumis]|uniref:CueP family metal-binding protein n=1 Tax=Isoptericola cucumis TaxID=1776856 RepID=UPI00280AE12B|nr:CueP family metal-binding protein [Isoptericola cucumis]
MLAEHGLEGLDARQIIDRLDAMPVAERPTDLVASVRPNEVVVTDDQQHESSVPMTSDEFYVSVAPYVDQTHECYFHSLTTCLGELQNASVGVTVTDDATGEVLIDEARQTFDNGFVGLWLPRGIDATISIEHDGRAGTSRVSTGGDEDATCLTSLQLTSPLT